METGFKVIATVCDQGPHNQGLAKSLGVTINSSFFEMAGQRIAFLYDIPHIFKNVRNNLMMRPYRIKLADCEGDVGWSTIVSFYEKYCKDGRDIEVCPKLTHSHVAPKSQEKMKVSLAVQVFIRKVSSAMIVLNRKLVESGVKNKETEDLRVMALFLRYMNDLFDALNTSSCDTTNPNEIKRPLQKDSQSFRLVQDALDFFSNRFEFLDKPGSTHKDKDPGFHKALLISLKSFLGLVDSIPELTGQDLPLFTRRLNQDPVENFFSVLRHKANDMTMENFRITFRNCIFTKNPGIAGNCEEDSDTTLFDEANIDDIDLYTDDFDISSASQGNPLNEASLTVDPIEQDLIAIARMNEDLFNSSVVTQDTDELLNGLERYTEERDDLGDVRTDQEQIQYHMRSNVISYFAGFCIKDIIKYIPHCVGCRTVLLSSQDDQRPDCRLIEARQYSIVNPALIYPSIDLSRVVEVTLDLLHENLGGFRISNHFKQGVTRFLLEKTNGRFDFIPECHRIELRRRILCLIVESIVRMKLKIINRKDFRHGKGHRKNIFGMVQKI